MQKCLNDITAEELQEVKNMSEVFFTPEEIATVLEYEPASFREQCETPGNEIYNAFAAGRLQSIYEVRKSVIKLAKAGSSPAQTMAMKMIENSTLKMMN